MGDLLVFLCYLFIIVAVKYSSVPDDQILGLGEPMQTLPVPVPASGNEVHVPECVNSVPETMDRVATGGDQLAEDV